MSRRGPISVSLDAAERRAFAAESRRRGLGLSTTIRTLAKERLADARDDDAQSRAHRWQRDQAWATWERINAGAGGAEVPWEDLEADLRRAARLAERH